MKKSLLSLGAFLLAVSGWAQAWQDVTETYIKNADFSETETVNSKVQPKDWAFTNLEACDAKARVVEFYAGWNALNFTEAEASQTVNLPAGTYKLEGHSFFRQGQNWDTDKSKSLGYIYAGEEETLVSTLGSVDVSSYANDKSQAGTAFYTDNLYPVSVEFVVSEAGEVEIGFRCTFDAAYSWMIFGEVALYQEMDYAEMFSVKKANLEAVLAELGETTVYVKKITEALADGEQVMEGSDADAQAEMLEGLESLYQEVLGVLPKAKELNGLIATCTSLMDNTTEKVEGAKKSLETGLTLVKAMSESIETVEDLDGKIEQVEGLRQEYILQALPAEGETLDYTFLIDGIGNSTSGWVNLFTGFNENYQYNGSATNKNNGELQKTGYIEAWNNNVKFTGTLTYTATELPIGRYNISAYTFQAANDTVMFFANDKSVEMSHETDLYTLSEVKDVAVNGTLSLGLDMSDTATWTGITNIRLEYVGQLDAATTYAAYQSAYYQLESYTYGTLNTALTEDVKAVLDANKDVAQDDVTALELAYKALIEKAKEIQPLAELYAGVKEAYDAAVAEAENSTETVEGAKATFEGVLEAQGEALDVAATAEDLEAVAEAVETARQAYVANAKPNRSHSLDYTFKIENASFESGELAPWTATSANDTGVKKNAEPNYNVTNADGDYIFNTWGGTSEKDVQQTVTGLPAGVYSLTVLVATDANLKVAVTAGSVTDTMTVANDKTYGEDFTVERVTVGEDGELLIKVSSTDWFKVDNFRLTRVSEEYDEVKLTSISPATEDDLTDGITEFILTFDQDVTLNEGEDAPVVSLMRNILTPSAVEGAANQIKLTPAEPVTAAGRYVLMIPELLVLDADGNYNADTTFVYTVPEKVIDTETYEYVSVNPAEGKVESLKDIEITFAEGSYACIDWLVEEQQQPYLLNTTTQEQIGVSLESVSLDFVTDLNKIRAVVAEEVTEEGAYTLVIPARLIFEGNDEWGSSVVDYAPEIRINYTIGEDEGDGIDAILAEGGTVDVYTVSGVLVKKDAGAADLKSLKKGIYIINGKKMAVK